MTKAQMLLILEFGDTVEPMNASSIFAVARKNGAIIESKYLPYNGHAIFFTHENYQYVFIQVVQQNLDGPSNDSTAAGRIKIPTNAEIDTLISMLDQSNDAHFETNEFFTADDAALLH
jgi:hypothetical protein